jgi:hypothetical protein
MRIHPFSLTTRASGCVRALRNHDSRDMRVAEKVLVMLGALGPSHTEEFLLPTYARGSRAQKQAVLTAVYRLQFSAAAYKVGGLNASVQCAGLECLVPHDS